MGANVGVNADDQCRSRKSKCGAMPPEPCSNCIEAGIGCTWPVEDGRSSRARMERKSKMTGNQGSAGPGDVKPILPVQHRHASHTSNNGGGTHHGGSGDDGEAVWLDQLLNHSMMPPRQGELEIVFMLDNGVAYSQTRSLRPHRSIITLRQAVQSTWPQQWARRQLFPTALKQCFRPHSRLCRNRCRISRLCRTTDTRHPQWTRHNSSGPSVPACPQSKRARRLTCIRQVPGPRPKSSAGKSSIAMTKARLSKSHGGDHMGRQQLHQVRLIITRTRPARQS